MSEKNILLGARIKELRKRKGLSQDQLAEKVGIESKYLSRLEVGKRAPSFDTLEKIADSLAVELHELFNFSHHDHDLVNPRGIERMVAKATPEELTLIFKVTKAILS